MGWESVSFSVSASVSRHNSDKDKRDIALWKDLHDRVKAIVNEEKYAPIIPDFMGSYLAEEDYE